ncbi:hypothetical protein M422DRAFT_238934 [Sphaerobolus stellatus SS14]|nr:hypothetical protein M422DRAFT_238934 [Sphaerobolus stellatus SS14]
MTKERRRLEGLALRKRILKHRKNESDYADPREIIPSEDRLRPGRFTEVRVVPTDVKRCETRMTEEWCALTTRKRVEAVDIGSYRLL